MTRLECDAFCLCADLYLTMPRRYTAPPPPGREDDLIWKGWHRCSDLSMVLSIEIRNQANRLRLKAGLPPIPEPCADDDVPPGSTPRTNGTVEPLPAG